VKVLRGHHIRWSLLVIVDLDGEASQIPGSLQAAAVCSSEPVLAGVFPMQQQGFSCGSTASHAAARLHWVSYCPGCGAVFIMQGITAYMEPGVLTALMGGTGAGKTTLMDV
jgi:ABC-type transport system involved in cytochrome bd biosynthesis fused ATPase/permease subunit